MLFSNSLIKKLKKQLLSINQLIESFFNRFQNILKSKKRYKFIDIDKKVFFVVGFIVIITSTYFLIPSYYDKNELKSFLKNQLYDQYRIELLIDKKITYGLLPKPHFSIKDVFIIHNKKKIAKVENTKIYISIDNFISMEKIRIKDVIFDKSEFEANLENISFFKKILNSNRSLYKVLIKDSKLFFKDEEKDTVFIIKIKNLTSTYTKNFENKFDIKYEIFNIPSVLEIRNNKAKKKIFTKLKSKSIKLTVVNEFDYNEEKIDGIINVSVMSKDKSFNYLIDDNTMEITSDDKNFIGKIEFKPFYLVSNLNFIQLNLKRLLNNNSLFMEFLNSGIFNNQNLNINLNINFDKINNFSNLNDFILKIFLEEGYLKISDSSFKWKDDTIINLNNVQLDNQNETSKVIGEITIDLNDLLQVYSYFQLSREFRKNIEKIKFDFIYDLVLGEFTIDNVRVDDELVPDINNFINDFESINFGFNKVKLRNFIKNLFIIYAG